MPLVRYAGVPIDAGDTQYIVPPVNVGWLKANPKILDTLDSPETSPSDRVAARFTVIMAAIRRNYPDMTEDQAAEWLDLGTLVEAYKAAIGVPGERTKGEE